MRTIDLREHRPSAVMVIDLVKHSTRSQETVYDVQHRLEVLLNSTKKALGLSDAIFNYTGDGYVCALVGTESSRILDFVNILVPQLSTELSAHAQAFRIGLDFGLIHLRDNPLTDKAEFFDSPAVVAARLESSAGPNRVLCSQRFHSIFSEYYPNNFSADLMTVQAKDRTLSAYEVSPISADDVSRLVMDYLLGKSTVESDISTGRRRILVVDDEPYINGVMTKMIRNHYPNAKVETFARGDEAVASITKGTVGVVFLDIMMNGLDGIASLERLVEIDSEIAPVMVTAIHDISVAITAMRLGAVDYILKPFEKEVLTGFLDSWATMDRLRRAVRFMTEDRTSFIHKLKNMRTQIESIRRRVYNREDRVARMIEHRMKHDIADFSQFLAAARDLSERFDMLTAELKCLERLAQRMIDINAVDFSESLSVFMSDLQKLHGAVTFDVDCTIKELPGRLAKELPSLMLVVSELVQNALDAMKNSGQISLSAAFLRSRHSVLVAVADSGPGVPKRIREKMFLPGVSTKGIGRGLGLALVWETVRALGGEITYSCDDLSTFKVLLPAQ